MRIEKAIPVDCSILTEITKRSKAYWGYSQEQIGEWAADLTISEEYLVAYSTYKLILENEIIGYYSFRQREDYSVILDNMFLLPGHIGKGYGKLMMDDFLGRLVHLKADKVMLESEPHAEKFYRKFGFREVDKRESSIPGRFLPVMELRVGKS